MAVVLEPPPLMLIAPPRFHPYTTWLASKMEPTTFMAVAVGPTFK